MISYKDLIEKKNFKKMTIKDVVKEAGGKAKILKKCKTDDCAADVLAAAETSLMKKYLKKYSEVGEMSNTVMWDWIDSYFEDTSGDK